MQKLFKNQAQTTAERTVLLMHRAFLCLLLLFVFVLIPVMKGQLSLTSQHFSIFPLATCRIDFWKMFSYVKHQWWTLGFGVLQNQRAKPSFQTCNFATITLVGDHRRHSRETIFSNSSIASKDQNALELQDVQHFEGILDMEKLMFCYFHFILCHSYLAQWVIHESECDKFISLVLKNLWIQMKITNRSLSSQVNLL